MPSLIYIVAGESSGDILGASLIRSLKNHFPDARFVGVGGELMIKQGLHSVYPMERLAVMGIGPILARLFELLKFRKKLAKEIVAHDADLFIGIDAPVFNTSLEHKLKQAGIKTVHYVSPSVWAWRESRIHKIKQSVDLMLCLFPFELKIYQQHQVKAVCVGHPLADQIEMDNDPQTARQKLGIRLDSDYCALLPGSRSSEIHYLLPVFLETAKMLSLQFPELKFLIPVAQQKHMAAIKSQVEQSQLVDKTTIVQGQSRDCMQASNLILLASGTATLEAALIKRPMVVAYKMSALSVWVYRRFLKISNFALPNLLSGKPLVPEFMQEDCTAERLFEACSHYLANPEERQILKEEYNKLHLSLKRNGSEIAADAISKLLDHDLVREEKDNNE